MKQLFMWNQAHVFNLWPKKVSEQLSRTLKCLNVLANTRYKQNI